MGGRDARPAGGGMLETPGGVALVDVVDGLLPALTDDLFRLVRIPSVAYPGFPEEPVEEAAALVMELLRSAGVEDVETLDLPGTAPIIVGGIPAPPGAPTVLLYAHYDVQPAGDEALWQTPPFEPDARDGAIYGRGAADDKSNVMVHIGALRACEGRPPVGIRLVIEGQEERGSPFDTYPPSHPERFQADAIVIADAGNVRPGVPTLTVAVRGDVQLTVSVRTLAGAKHSGDFGGAAPDALVVLLHALATLHDEHGDVAVRGLLRVPWTGYAMTDEAFRTTAGVAADVPLFGTGGLGERLWTGPALTITGLDAPPVATAVNVVVPFARAQLDLRVHPAQDAREALAALVAHLERVRPFGIALELEPGEIGAGFVAATTGPAYAAARSALATAWGREPVEAACGGSIPLVRALHEAVPTAEILLFGAEDAECDLHAPNERVLIDELRRSVIAEVEFFRAYAAQTEVPR